MNIETWVLSLVIRKGKLTKYAVKKPQVAGFQIYKLMNWSLDCGELTKGRVQPLIDNQFISTGHISHSHLLSECVYLFPFQSYKVKFKFWKWIKGEAQSKTVPSSY